MCVSVYICLNLLNLCVCVQWTLFDLGFSPNIAKGMQWIHVHVSVCVNASVNACVVECKVIHWLRKTKYDIQPHILSRATQHIHTNTCKHTLKACVYSLNCVQNPRGCLLGSLGPDLGDVINQFRGSWEGSRRGAAGNWSNRSITQKRLYFTDP